MTQFQYQIQQRLVLLMEKQLIRIKSFIRHARTASNESGLSLTPIGQKVNNFIESPEQYSDNKSQIIQLITPNRRKYELRDISDKINQINEFLSEKNECNHPKKLYVQTRQNIGKLARAMENCVSMSKKNPNFQKLQIVEQEPNSITQSCNTRVEISSHQNQSQALRMLLSPNFFQKGTLQNESSGYQYDSKPSFLNTQRIVIAAQQEPNSSDQMAKSMQFYKKQRRSKPRIGLSKKTAISLKNNQIKDTQHDMLTPQSKNTINSVPSTQRSLKSFAGHIPSAACKFMSITLKKDINKSNKRQNKLTSSVKSLSSTYKQQRNSSSSRKGIKIVSAQKNKSLKDFQQQIQQIRRLKQNLKQNDHKQAHYKQNNVFKKKAIQRQIVISDRKILTIDIKSWQNRELRHKKIANQKHNENLIRSRQNKPCSINPSSFFNSKRINACK